VLTAAVTPFTSTGGVDMAALDDLMGFYATSGVQGIFALGTASEAMLMETGLRMSVTERLSTALDGRLPVLLHCGTPSTDDTVTLVRHAAELGVGQVAAIAPYYFAYAPRDVERHFMTVASSTRLPVYVYDNPATVGYGVSLDTLTRLLAGASNIVGVKDTGDSVGRVVRYLALDRPPRVYTGNNELIYPSLAVGAEGAVSALSATMPELVSSVFVAFESGDAAAALRLQLLVARVMAAIQGMPYIGAIKAIGRLRGLPVGHVRGPQRDLDSAEQQELVARLSHIEGLAEYLAAP